MLFDMLRKMHDDEHIQVLLKFTKEQRDLHQEQNFTEETEQYRTWMNKAAEKGCRGLCRCLKKDEMPFIRPFQT